jgi:hypothetical protein
LKAATDQPLEPLVFGLAVLFGIVLTTGLLMAPEPVTFSHQRAMLWDQRASMYFMEAQVMAKPFLQAPSGHWSRYTRGSWSGCQNLGNNVWRACGTIEVQASDSRQSLFWEVFFLPDDQKPIFIRVGKATSGDYIEALKQAAGMPTKEKGAGLEK